MDEDENHRGTGDVLGDTVRQLRDLILSLARLAQVEISDSVGSLSRGVGICIAALLAAWMAIFFILLGVAASLMMVGLSAAQSLFAVAVALALLAIILGLAAKAAFARARLLPTHTIEQMRSSLRSVKESIRDGGQ